MARTKITVKIYAPLLRNFVAQLDELHLKRDSFMEAMIRAETPNLASDLRGKRQSDRARLHISRQLKRMGTLRVNVEIDKAVAKASDKVVAESNVVRDAFVNRLIMFLRGSDWLLNYLGMPSALSGSQIAAGLESMPTSPMKAIQAVQADPLYYFRAYLEESQEKLYLALMPEQLIGFSCYLDDAHVPGTEGHAESKRQLERMFRDIDLLEKRAFASSPAGVKQ